MSSSLFTAPHIYCTIPHPSDTKHEFCFPTLQKVPIKRFIIFCNSSKFPPRAPSNLGEPQNRTPSLSEQLQPLSNSILSEQPNQAQPLTKPKSIWVNPTNPKLFLLTLQRQKRSSVSHISQIRDLKIFAKKLNDCDDLEAAFMAVLEEIPHPPNRDNALLVINCLRPWKKTLLFFNWIKTQNLFPIETIFYNVNMKSLRFGRQFQHIEDLAFEMVNNGVELDNITFSTIISCAKRCKLFDKAVEWFERMYKTGLVPDEVTYSSILDMYAKLGKVEEVISLYERGKASGWKPDHIALAVLGKMFGKAGDYDGIRYVLEEMNSLEVHPNLALYNTLIEAMGNAGKPVLARNLFEEMVSLEIAQDEKTLTALIKIYGKARWARYAMEIWERMKSNGWPMDFILYNTLLSMCADLGLEVEAERLFEDMKGSEHCKPDSWSYTAMFNIYGSLGNVEKAMALFEELSVVGIQLNVMGCTCLIQCLGRAKRIDELDRVFVFSIERGIKPDDRLCVCLLSVLSYCKGEDVYKVLACLEKANKKLVTFVKLLENEKSSFDTIVKEFREILNRTSLDARRPFCNCLIDICRNKNLQERAHEVLYMGTAYGLYPGLHTKTAEEWRLNVRALLVGAALTAFEEWMGSMSRLVDRNEALPEIFSALTGAGTHKYSHGLGSAFASHVKKFSAPFRQSEDNAGLFVANSEELVAWIRSRALSSVVTD